MCATCHNAKGVVEYAGDVLCRRCGTLREWAFVIGLIQDRLEPAPDSTGSAAPVPVDVAADPFAAA